MHHLPLPEKPRLRRVSPANGPGGADCPRIPTNATPECRRPLITLKDVAWFLYVYPLRWIAFALPAGAVRLAGRVAEPLCQLLTRRDRKRMRANLARALGPGASESQLRRISRQWVANGVRRAFDALARRASGSLPRHNRMDVCRLEHLERAAGGNGVIIVTGHFFASHLIRLSLTERGYSVLAVGRGRPLDWALGRFGERFVQPRYRSLRSKHDRDSVSTEDPGCALQILKQLRLGGLVVIHMDSPFSRDVVPWPFLGGHFRFSTGFLEIARQTGCALVPALATGDGSAFAVSLDEPVRLLPAPTWEEFISANLPLLVSRLESWILEYPAQWESWLSLEP